MKLGLFTPLALGHHLAVPQDHPIIYYYVTPSDMFLLDVVGHPHVIWVLTAPPPTNHTLTLLLCKTCGQPPPRIIFHFGSRNSWSHKLVLKISTLKASPRWMYVVCIWCVIPMIKSFKVGDYCWPKKHVLFNKGNMMHVRVGHQCSSLLDNTWTLL